MVRDSTVSGNRARGGGGIFLWFGTATLTDSTVIHNTADLYDGGGILNGDDGTMTITNSTVSGNTAGSIAGGISNHGTLTFAAPPTTVGGNTAQYAPGGVSNNVWSGATVTGGCPSPAGYVTYYPANSPGDYGGFTC